MSVPSDAKGTLIDLAMNAPKVVIEDLVPDIGVLIISPHPDDETLGCGQALAAASVARKVIGLVMVTDGEGSHSLSPSYTPERLTRLRSTELQKALEALCPEQCVHRLNLHLRDGCSCKDDLGDWVFYSTLALANQVEASAVWTTWSGDPHCDHVTAAVLARQICDELDVPLLQFPIWGRFGETTDVPVDVVRFESRFTRRRKRTALAAYRSQFTNFISDDPSAFMMPDKLLEHFADHPEIFIRG